MIAGANRSLIRGPARDSRGHQQTWHSFPWNKSMGTFFLNFPLSCAHRIIYFKRKWSLTSVDGRDNNLLIESGRWTFEGQPDGWQKPSNSPFISCLQANPLSSEIIMLTILCRGILLVNSLCWKRSSSRWDLKVIASIKHNEVNARRMIVNMLALKANVSWLVITLFFLLIESKRELIGNARHSVEDWPIFTLTLSIKGKIETIESKRPSHSFLSFHYLFKENTNQTIS